MLGFDSGKREMPTGLLGEQEQPWVWGKGLEPAVLPGYKRPNCEKGEVLSRDVCLRERVQVR